MSSRGRAWVCIIATLAVFWILVVAGIWAVLRAAGL